jgi:hypothetical protein
MLILSVFGTHTHILILNKFMCMLDYRVMTDVFSFLLVFDY